MISKPGKSILKSISLILTGEILFLHIMQLKFIFNSNLPSGKALLLFGLSVFLVVCISFFMLLFYSRRRLEETLMFSMMLILSLFAYPIKQSLIYHSPDIVSVFFYVSTRADWSEAAVANYLFHEYLALIALTLGMIFVGVLSKGKHHKKVILEHAVHVSKSRSWMSLVIAFILIVVLLFLMKSVGIYMGAGGVSLPFHMAGIILYSHLTLVPVLLLLALIWWPSTRYTRTFSALIILAFFSYILGDMFIRLSRSTLLVVMMLVIGFFAVYRPLLLRRFFLLGGAAVIATLILIPLVTSLRMANINDNWNPHYLREQYAFYSDITINLFLMRIIGAESASLALTELREEKVGFLQVLSKGVTQFYTREILAVPDEQKSGFSPSALGEVHLLFGGIAGYVLIIAWPWVLQKISQAMNRWLGSLYPIGFAFLFAFSIKSVSEGIYFKDIAILTGAVCVVFVINALFKVRSSKHNNVLLKKPG